MEYKIITPIFITVYFYPLRVIMNNNYCKYIKKALASCLQGLRLIYTKADGLSTEVIVHDRRFFYTKVGKHGNYGL